MAGLSWRLEQAGTWERPAFERHFMQASIESKSPEIVSFPRGLGVAVGVVVWAEVCERTIERDTNSKRTRNVKMDRIVACV